MTSDNASMQALFQAIRYVATGWACWALPGLVPYNIGFAWLGEMLGWAHAVGALFAVVFMFRAIQVVTYAAADLQRRSAEG
jgi:hypothetical protein